MDGEQRVEHRPGGEADDGAEEAAVHRGAHARGRDGVPPAQEDEGGAVGRGHHTHVGAAGLGYRAAQELTRGRGSTDSESLGVGAGSGAGRTAAAHAALSSTQNEQAGEFSSGPDALGAVGGVDEPTASIADFNDAAHYEKRLLGVYKRTEEMRQKRAGAMEVCV